MAITNRPVDHGAIANAVYRHMTQEQEFRNLMMNAPVRREGDAIRHGLLGQIPKERIWEGTEHEELEPLPDDEILAELEINNWPCGYEIKPR